jgi:thiamine-phosphate pyrophosphorylase
VTALRGLEARLRLARLVLRTDARSRQGDLTDFLAAAFAGGVDVVQLVQGELDVRTGREVLEEVARVAAPAQVVVGVVGDPVWAGAIGAVLLHLGADDGPAAEVRAHLHPSALLGRSVRDVAEVDAARADDALDYLEVLTPGAGPDLDLDLVRHAARVAPVFDVAAPPWFAAGGVTPATLDRLLHAGARRVRVGSVLTTADDPQEVAARLARPLTQAWRADPAAERYHFAAAASRGRPR